MLISIKVLPPSQPFCSRFFLNFINNRDIGGWILISAFSTVWNTYFYVKFTRFIVTLNIYFFNIFLSFTETISIIGPCLSITHHTSNKFPHSTDMALTMSVRLLNSSFKMKAKKVLDKNREAKTFIYESVIK